jgi:hypothetical protein
MKRFRQWLFNGLAALCLLLCVAIVVIRSRGNWGWHGLQLPLGRWLVTTDLPNSSARVRVTVYHSYPNGISGTVNAGSDLGTSAVQRQYSYVDWNTPAVSIYWGPSFTMYRVSPTKEHFQLDGTGVGVRVSCWLVETSLLAVFMVAWTRGRWLRNNIDPDGHPLCLTCGYDLRATPERCPECGTIPAKP